MGNERGERIPGSKTGIMRKRTVNMDGSEGKTNRTGVYERHSKLPDNDNPSRESDKPPTLPEQPDGDGSTTGVMPHETEGRDPARRENHPRR